MTLINDTSGTDVYRSEGNILFVDHPSHDVTVAKYIDHIHSTLEREPETEHFVYSSGYSVGLTELDISW